MSRRKDESDLQGSGLTGQAAERATMERRETKSQPQSRPASPRPTEKKSPSLEDLNSMLEERTAELVAVTAEAIAYMSRMKQLQQDIERLSVQVEIKQSQVKGKQELTAEQDGDTPKVAVATRTATPDPLLPDGARKELLRK